MDDGSLFSKLSRFVQEACGDRTTIGDQIRLMRKARGYTQQALADRLNRGSTWVSDAENGHLPTATTLKDIEAIAHALNCHAVEKASLVDAFVCHLLTHIGE